MAEVSITHPSINGGSSTQILCQKVTLSFKKNLQSKPNINGSSDDDLLGPSEVQTQSLENGKYVIDGVYFTGDSNTLTWADIVTLLKRKYNGTGSGPQSYITLNITTDASWDVIGLEESTNIKCVLETITLPIDASESKGGYRPNCTMILQETG